MTEAGEEGKHQPTRAALRRATWRSEEEKGIEVKTKEERDREREGGIL